MNKPNLKIDTEAGRNIAIFQVKDILIIFMSVLLFITFISDNQILLEPISSLIGNSKNKSTVSTINSIVRFIVIIVSAVSVAWTISKSVFETIKYSVIDPYRDRKMMGNRLLKKKIEVDIKNFCFAKQITIDQEIQSILSDSQPHRFSHISSSSLLNEKNTFWEIDESIFSNKYYKAIRDIRLTSTKGEMYEKYEKTIEEIWKAKAKLNLNSSIELNVAAVQPAFYYIFNKVIKDGSIEDICTIKKDFETGPQTVSSTILEKIKNKNTLVAFISPLSAFLTAEIMDGSKKIDPREFFVPIISLTEEDQILFYIEGGSSIYPRSKPRLFYLNNSTAEESVARLDNSFHSKYWVYPIDNYDDYKKLLNGETIIEKNSLKLENGDGIILWSPLSDHFQNKELNDRYIFDSTRLSTSDLHGKSTSRIMLFGEKSFNKKKAAHRNLYLSVLKAIIIRSSLENKILEEKNKVFYDRQIFTPDYELHFKKIFN